MLQLRFFSYICIMNITYNKNFKMPAEWYPQSGIQLTWPHSGTDWNEYLHDITETFVELARIIAKREKLLLVSPCIDDLSDFLSSRLDAELFKNLIFYHCETNDTWARDHAFISLVCSEVSHRFQFCTLLLDFGFNGWGNKFASGLDNAINQNIYFMGAFNGAIISHKDFILEGGSIESDGKGTIFTTSSCLLAPNRNQPLTKGQIEHRLKEMLNAERILWIDHGQLIGDDTDGHIDTIVRIAPDDTLLYVACDDKNDEQYDDFKLMEEQLKTFRTTDGKPYRLLPLPMPDAIYDGEDRLPATYANFLIINGAVIYPTYNQPEKDRKAAAVIKKAFPDREIIGVDSRTVIRQHGSLHCLSMQFPKGVIV